METQLTAKLSITMVSQVCQGYFQTALCVGGVIVRYMDIFLPSVTAFHTQVKASAAAEVVEEQLIRSN